MLKIAMLGACHPILLEVFRTQRDGDAIDLHVIHPNALDFRLKNIIAPGPVICRTVGGQAGVTIRMR